MPFINLDNRKLAFYYMPEQIFPAIYFMPGIRPMKILHNAIKECKPFQEEP